ncbi:hypothetical protein ACFQV8_18490 [Pseudonocardia benzenivorans]
MKRTTAFRIDPVRDPEGDAALNAHLRDLTRRGLSRRTWTQRLVVINRFAKFIAPTPCCPRPSRTSNGGWTR